MGVPMRKTTVMIYALAGFYSVPMAGRHLRHEHLVGLSAGGQ